MRRTIILLTTSVLAIAGFAIAQDKKAEEAAPKLERKPAPKGAKAYIIGLKDGKEVKKKFVVRFGLKNMGVAPAGIKFPNTGHHHLLIDTDESTVDMDKPLPMSDKIKHFGAGQTETILELAPGKHTLQLLVGDELHLPHDPPVISKKITITVKGE